MKTNIAASDKVILALIGAGGRGTQVILGMQQCTPGVEVKYVCDVDKQRGGRAINELTKQQGYAPKRIEDMRDALEDKDIDAVVICTPEHWHALATVWACQAGKDVYVEKNVTLNIPEGKKMKEAAKKYNCIIQCGTQNRSADFAFSARDYIQSGKLGNIVHVKAFCMLPGGKPLNLKPDSEVPEGLDWNMWLGPAEKVPYNVSRHKGWLDWWAYNGGQPMSGDTSHVIDLARLVLGDPGHPASVFCAGGRVLYDDKAEIPDIQTVTFDYEKYTMACVTSKFGKYMTKTSPEIRYGEKFPDWQFNSTRIEIYGTEGMMYVGRHGGGWQVFSADNELVAQEYGMFPDTAHQIDFIESIRSRKKPNADIFEGHKSAVLIHLANTSYRIGENQLYFDVEKESFMNSPEANELSKGSYRKGFEIPEVL